MEHRQIGSLSVSVTGIGCNNFGRRLDAQATEQVVSAAIDAGINFFDTADIYGDGLSEEYLGRALGNRRDQVIVASKFGMKMSDGRHGARPEYIRSAIEDSLQRLGMDHIDLYYLHTPDETVPIADTLGTLQELVDRGLVREIGCSNFSVAQLQEALDTVTGDRARFECVQNHYSLLHRAPEQDGVLDWCAENGTALIPFFPLHNGLLTGKYRLGQERPDGTRLSGTPRGDQLLTEANLRLIEDLINWCEARDRTLIELAFGWLLASPQVASVIAGATSPAQVAANAAAAGWIPAADERQQLLDILAAHGA